MKTHLQVNLNSYTERWSLFSIILQNSFDPIKPLSIDLNNMAQSWKRLKSNEDDEVEVPQDNMSLNSSKEEFNWEISSFWNNFLNNSINQNQSTKNLVTKNSTNDEYETLLNTLSRGADKEEESCFEIKSGLNKLKGLKNQPEAFELPSFNFEEDFEPFNFSNEPVNQPKMDAILGEIQIFKSDEERKLRKFIENILNCPRFISEFNIQNLENWVNQLITSQCSNFKFTGKLELSCQNLSDTHSYTVTAIDSSIYEEDFMSSIYTLSSLRDGNPHVCKYFGSWKENEIYFIQTENSLNILSKMINSANSSEDEGERGTTLTSSMKSQLVLDLLMGIEYCHNKGVCGFPVSSDSVFLSETNKFKLKSFENFNKSSLNHSRGANSKKSNCMISQKTEDLKNFCRLVQKLITAEDAQAKIAHPWVMLETLYELADSHEFFPEFPQLVQMLTSPHKQRMEI